MNKIVRDQLKRFNYHLNEVKVRVLQYENIQAVYAWPVGTQRKLKITNNFLKRYNINKIKNRCIYTGRSRSVLSSYKISRIKFRQEALSKSLPGVKLASW
uniref:Ribosomal protein S14 n=1 Tax=Gloeochaete wittrockiana TaxID=38269 RepID=A0A096Y6V2_9EUKA|nr:ribosomal protein S14 [Gloeochaete wittrockiana]AIM52049.1 ribosomal protein S14 [Gloeochaete wittrockiana]